MDRTDEIRAKLVRLKRSGRVFEILAGLAIGAILAGLLLGLVDEPSFNPGFKNACDDIEKWAVALNEYRIVHNSYPASLGAIIPPPASMTDPWERPYVYVLSSTNKFSYHLFSAGPDGVAGTADDVDPSQGRD